jgi:DNA-binding NtrC family response regulator
MPTAPQFPVSETTVLAVDDDRAILELIGGTLREAGYRVLLAHGGRNAIELYEESTDPIHLLLTDVIMPDLTGPVLAERLRRHDPQLPVLFISGFHDADLVQRFVTSKGFALLPKPFTMEALLRVVQQSLTAVPR